MDEGVGRDVANWRASSLRKTSELLREVNALSTSARVCLNKERRYSLSEIGSAMVGKDGSGVGSAGPDDGGRESESVE